MEKSKMINDDSGATAVSVLISPSHIYVAHCGDSRAVISRGTRVSVFATKDHKTSSKTEKKRIRAAGGFVANGRVQGILAMSRALGDFGLKGNKNKKREEQMVIAKPNVTVIERNDETDEFIALGCDGIFDVMSNSKLTSFIRNQMSKTNDLKKICSNVLDHCLTLGSTDNMSLIIIPLPGCPSKVELKRRKKIGLNQMNRAIRQRRMRKANGNNNANIVRVGSSSKGLGLKNPFILYFLDQWKQNGGNVCKVAKTCGKKWGTLPRAEKQKYVRRYQYHKRKQNKRLTTH